MSFLPTYPLVFLPDGVKANLEAEATPTKPAVNKLQHGRSSLPRFPQKLAIQPKFNPPVIRKIKLVKLKEAVGVIRYLGWFFTGAVSVLLIRELLAGAEVIDLVPGIILLCLKTGLISALNYGASYLEQAQQDDRQELARKYWQDNLLANQDYYQQLPDLLRDHHLKVNPQLKLSLRKRNKSKTLSFKLKVNRGIAKTEAQKGVSEAYFLTYLQRYFADCELNSDYFALNDAIGYTTDFSLIVPGGYAIDIEIDEPYEGKSKAPHHCQDDDKDRNRNNYLCKLGWIVIRFSEYQVVRHPESCCRLIALVLSKLGCDRYLDARSLAPDGDAGSHRYLEPLKDFANLPTDRAWTSGSVKGMVARKYRESYLAKAGLFTYDAAREKRNLKVAQAEKARKKRRFKSPKKS